MAGNNPGSYVFIQLNTHQAWPLTPTFGAVGGYILSSMCALTVNAFEQLAQEQPPVHFDSSATEHKDR